MYHRYEFKDFVLNRSFKYYTFNMHKQRIEEFRQLEAREKSSLTSHWKSFGFHNENEAIQAVDNIMQHSDWGGAWEWRDSVSCLNLNPGTTVEMEVDYGKKIRLLFLGDFSYFVCNDDHGFLRYGDILFSLSGGVSCRQTTYFCATRDGRPFPQPGTAVAFTPKSLRQSIGIMVEQSTVDPMSTSYQSIPFIYAWRANTDKHGNVWFSEEQLTDNNEAVLCLDLIDGTFKLNEHFNPQLYNAEGINLIRDVFKFVSNADGNDWSAIHISCLSMLDEGLFTLDGNNNSLIVTKRMTITSNQSKFEVEKCL